MNIIECEREPKIPKFHVTYVIAKGETVESCIQRFKAKFGSEPKTALHWREFLYCEKP
jgi:hypothetical protein